LPADLQAGTYRLWVRLYQSNAPDQILPVYGAETDSEQTGILPIRIDIIP
jgi:hypothetical protein